MGKIKQIVANYNGNIENVYPVTLAEAVMYYANNELVSLKDYLDEFKGASGDYLPLPKDNTTKPSYLIGTNDNGSETYQINQIPAEFLPSYVDDVIEGTLNKFPKPGETGKIYVDTVNNLSYRWTGSTYIEIGKSTVLNDAGSLSNPVYITGGKATACDIQIGGRNILLHEDFTLNSSALVNAGNNQKTWNNTYANITTYGIKVAGKKNTKLIMSFDYEIVNNTYNGTKAKFLVQFAGGTWQSFVMFNDLDTSVLPAGSTGRISKTLTISANHTQKDLRFVVVDLSTNSGTFTLKLSNLKLELGNQPTDWTLAPEDIQNNINTAKNEVINGNVASATKLQTSRSLWGNSFNGSADIAGTIKFAPGSNGGNIWVYNAGIKVVAPTTSGFAMGLSLHDNTGDINLGGAIGFYGSMDNNAGYVYSYIGDTYSSNNLRVYAGGNVTIGGTSAPSEKLFINGTLRAFDTKLDHIRTDYGVAYNWTDVWTGTDKITRPNYGLYFGDPNSSNPYGITLSGYFGVSIHTANGTVKVNQNGNVGIGTTSPAYKLDVQGSFRCTDVKSASFLGTDADGKLITKSLGNATQSVQGLMSAADKKKLDGIASGANAYSHPTSAGNKHIPSGGKDGQILRWSADGTAVWGNDNNTTYNVVSTTANGLCPKRSGTTTKFLRDDGTWAVPPDTNTIFVLSAATSDSLGGVRIGYKASGKNYAVQLDSNSKMYVNVPWTDNNTDTKVTQTASSTNSNYPILASASTAPNGTATTAIYNANIKMNPSTGSVTATAFYQTSDINKKNIHGNINLSIEDILSIPTIEFNYKEDDKTHIGTIAQEVEKVCPEIVNTDDEGIKSIDYAKLSILAIKALKDNHTELQNLKNEVEQIKALLHGKV